MSDFIGHFPDVEVVLTDLLTSIAYTCSTLPDTEEEFTALLPLIWVRRTGGRRDLDNITDNPQVQLATHASTRAEAFSLMNRVTTAIESSPGTTVNGVLIDSVNDITGAEQIPDIDPTSRMAQATFVVSFRRHIPAVTS